VLRAKNSKPKTSIWQRFSINVIEIEEDPEDYLDWWNLLDQTDIKTFKKKIQALKKHIQQTIQTPLKDRGKPRW
jgi:hypothetical protein